MLLPSTLLLAPVLDGREANSSAQFALRMELPAAARPLPAATTARTGALATACEPDTMRLATTWATRDIDCALAR
jgi:hypothetical protein